MPDIRPQISMQVRTFTDDVDYDWSIMLDAARAMDAADVDRLVVSDHIAFGDDPNAAYANPATGGTAGGHQPTGPDGLWLEPLTVLTAVAAVTKNIRLGTAILLAALRRPAVLAKTAATIDVLSGGRLDLGVGVGWQREEYEAVGLSFEERGRTLDHTLDVCRALWTQTRASYASPELTFDGIHQMPKPVQPGGIPIWVSGTVNNAVARRIARFKAGWIPWGADLADPARSIAAMRKRVSDAGGDPAAMPVQGYARVVTQSDRTLDIDATMASVPALIDAGVTDVRVTCAVPPDQATAIEFLSEVVAAFRSTTTG